jgi:signal peptidase I
MSEFDPKQPRENSQPTPENPWVEGIKTIALSAVLALGIRQFVAEARFIPSESMVPTLLVDDRLIIDKVSYKFNQPSRGDVVVFMPPDTAADCDRSKPKPEDAFIKRIIGMPGDKIEVKESHLYINDKMVQENYVNEPMFMNYGPSTVPPNQYLMMGDNRNHSCDGRTWGFVGKERIIGRAIVRFWPLNRMGNLGDHPKYEPTAIVPTSPSTTPTPTTPTPTTPTPTSGNSPSPSDIPASPEASNGVDVPLTDPAIPLPNDAASPTSSPSPVTTTP